MVSLNGTWGEGGKRRILLRQSKIQTAEAASILSSAAHEQKRQKTKFAFL